MGILYIFVMGFSRFILIYAIYCCLMEIIPTIMVIVLSYREAHRAQTFLSEAWQKTPELVPISIIAPAHNESEVVLESLSSFLSLHYPVL